MADPPPDTAAIAAKRARGERLTRPEAAALRKAEAADAKEARAAAFGSVTKREWAVWSGRQHKILDEQAIRYGIPIGGAEISLPEVARWIHDFLARHAKLLAHAGDDAEEITPRERIQIAEAGLRELELEYKLGRMLPRELVHQAHAEIASCLRSCGEALQRQFGDTAAKILNDALTNAQLKVDALLDHARDDHG